ncbi:MAG: hypothetical protein ACI9GM_001716, partial [Salibacteraceae bacterium]
SSKLSGRNTFSISTSPDLSMSIFGSKFSFILLSSASQS